MNVGENQKQWHKIFLGVCLFHHNSELKIVNMKKHVHSTQIDDLQKRINDAEKQLKKFGIYYDYPDELNENDLSNKFRIMRTKGNTKNQRKNLKKNHVKILTIIAEHLEEILRKNIDKQ